MKQQDSEHASDHDMPEDDKERMPEKYETVSLDDFVKYNIMKEILIFMVRVVSDRQASMVSVIMDCQREKMHHSFCVKSLYLVILMRLLVSMQHRKAILWMSRTQKNLISSFHKHLSMPAFVHLKQVLHILKAHLLPRY